MQKDTKGTHDLLERIARSTHKVRGEKTAGHDALLFLNTQYESFPVVLQQDATLSPSAKTVYNNLWIWAKTKNTSAIPAMLFPGYDYISRATGLERPTIASAITQLRIRRFLTLHNKVRNERGRFVGNDYILNDEPLPIPDTLSLDTEYIEFLNKVKTHRHLRVRSLAEVESEAINQYIHNSDDPLRPATHIEKMEARQQANLAIHNRLFPDEVDPDAPAPTEFYGIPIGHYNEGTHQVNKVNSVNLAGNDQDNNVNSVENHRVNHQVHKVNSDKSTDSKAFSKVNSVVNAAVNRCSSSNINNTTTTDTELTGKDKKLFLPKFDTPNEAGICEMIVRKLPEEHQQSILDELAGRMANPHQEKVSNPIGYLKWLINDLHKGNVPYTSQGLQVTARRNTSDLGRPTSNQTLQQDRQAMFGDIRHLESMIKHMKKYGQETDELERQMKQLQKQLDAPTKTG